MSKSGVVKNPLSVIAIFAGITEVSGAGILPFITPENQNLYIWFLMVFPFLLVALFFATLNWNHKALYAPSDYTSDASFLEGVRGAKSSRPEVSHLEELIEKDIDDALSLELPKNDNDPNERARIAEAIKSSIKKSSFITIDARPLTGNDSDVFELPYIAFPSINSLTDEVFFLIDNHVKPFEYGYSWVIRKSRSGEVIKNARMITGADRGTPCPDTRSLKELGIEPGMTLLVTLP
ncbi:hypothetical protein [Pseudomonas syringae]|uniref:hypothetical protein n=1 Tax=Pseudomonas syringae TaxID=317 RepID=UPI000467ED08|nr:hypothetical protein [Pseudomonas syringae]